MAEELKKIIDNLLGEGENDGVWSQEKRERNNGLRKGKNVGIGPEDRGSPGHD